MTNDKLAIATPPGKISVRPLCEALSFHAHRTGIHLSSVLCHLSFVICHLSFVMRTSFRRVRQPQAHNDARALTWLASNLQGGTEIFGARAHIGETETLAFANQLCLRQSGAIIRDPKHKV